MILFVFEGKKPEMALFEAIDSLLLHIGNEKIVTTFHTNFYKLYDEIQKDEDVLTLNLLKEWLWTKNNHSLDEYSTDDFTEIYLFFDYDLHAATSFLHLTTDDANHRVKEMLQIFNDEYEHGKLFVSYPMIESYLYTKKMPDSDFSSYTYKIADLANFKSDTNAFSDYTQNQFTTAHTKLENWAKAIMQNVYKANFLCKGQYSMPLAKDDITQANIFDCEVSQYVVPNAEVSILCALPLFVHYYLRPELFDERILSHIH
ncbi:MAG: hypothetical protein KBT03_01620 [Bacteroidales bacterium]|nr:hypothetical protein [Candidatus Scybalousia scybalohippi]